MESCERWFGVLFCGNLGKGMCPFAVNEALNGGNVSDRDKFVEALRGRDYDFVLRVFVYHSIDRLTDKEVLEKIPISYRECVARDAIAGAAWQVLCEMNESTEEVNLDELGRLAFDLTIDDDI